MEAFIWSMKTLFRAYWRTSSVCRSFALFFSFALILSMAAS